MQNAEKDLGARTKTFARRIIRLYAALLKATVAQVRSKQAWQSGASVGAVYRVANCARSKAEFISKVGDRLKAANETAYRLELLTNEEIVPGKRHGPLWQRANDLISLLVTIGKKAGSD